MVAKGVGEEMIMGRGRRSETAGGYSAVHSDASCDSDDATL